MPAQKSACSRPLERYTVSHTSARSMERIAGAVVRIVVEEGLVDIHPGFALDIAVVAALQRSMSSQLHCA